eukprot:511853_1
MGMDLQPLSPSDLATPDAIQIAKEVNTKAARTLGVVTKIDLMDQCANVLNILRGNIIPLQLGYICVMNRLQKDINNNNNNKTICNPLQSEKLFFKNHTTYTYSSITPYLAYKLNHIKKCLPDYKQDLEQEMASYGTPI